MLRNYYFLPCALLLLYSSGWSSLQAQGCLGSQRVDASYELANNDVCEGSEITVRNISEEFGNTNVIYIWDWGDGQRDTISGRENVTHTYNFFDQNACTAEDGLLVLELRLDARVPGCQQFNHFVIKPIYIFLRPVAQFEAEETICLPETTLRFKNTSCTADSAATYSWNFGDPASGSANTSTAFEPSHTFSGPGIYNVSLSVNSACGSGTFVKLIEVKEPPVVQVTLEKNPTTSCIPLDVRFRNASTGGLSYEWKVTPNRGYTFLDSTNLFSFEPRMLFFESGSYRVEFTATNECGDNTWSETIEVFEPPIVTLRPEPIACETLSYTPDVRYEGTVNSVRWTFSNATPATSTERMPSNIIFPPGRHLVRVEATSVCGTFEASDTIVVLSREAVNIEPVAPVCNTAQAFTLRATPAGGVWSGRGVSPVGLFTPSAASLGMNEITYTFGPAGCTSVATINVEVKNAAPIEPGPDETICIDAQPFTLSGFSPTGGVWQGSGITDSLQGRFSPAAAGLGNARLTYFYFDVANSCVATASRTITVAPLPVVTIAEDDVAFCITPDDIRLSENIDLQVTANDGSGRWSGTGITDASAGIFNGRDLPPGAYVLRYDYTSGAGCMAGDAVTVNLTEKQQVIAQADTTVCINQETLTLQATPDGGRWSGRNINTNNGSINLAQAGGGTFTYTYTLFANTTCEVRDEVQVEIIDLSGVSAGADVGFCASEMQVTLSGFSPAGGVWSGSGVVDNRNGVINVQALPPGAYTLTYQIESQAVSACAAQDQITLTVHPLPIADFTTDGNQCTGETFRFANTSTDARTYNWTFGDGRSATVQSPEIAYDAAGDYQVALTVRSAFGCESSITRTVHVSEPPPAIAFDADVRNGCADLQVNFTNLSRGEDISFQWDFGNGQTDTLFNPPPVIYTATANDTTYLARLTVRNGCGTGEYADSILVSPRPVASFGTLFNSFCSGELVEVVNTSFGNPDVYIWDFGNGRVSRQVTPDAQTYFTDSNPANYTITLVVSNGCGSDTLSQNLTINPTDVRAFFNLPAPEFCVGDTVRIRNFATPGARVSYDFGDGDVSADPSPTHVFTEAGSYRITQYAYGCGFDSTAATIRVLPLPEVQMLVEDQVCLNTTLTFRYAASEVSSSLWEFGDGNTSILVSPMHTYDTVGTYLLRLSVTDLNGCRASLQKTVAVLPLPQFTIENTDSLCAGENARFEVITDDNIGSYVWAFGDGEQQSGRIVQHLFMQAGTYTATATVTDLNGCTNTQRSSLFVRPTPEAAFSYTTAGDCAPVEIAFINQSKTANAYQWLFGDGATTTLTNPSRVFYEGGNFTTQLVASFDGICFDTTAQTITINAIPNIDFQTQNITCYGNNDGRIEILTGGQNNTIAVYGPDYFQQGINLFSGLKSGFYDIEVVGPTGCDTTYLIEITQPDSIIMFIRQDTAAIITGDTVRVEVFSNYSDLAYRWFPDTAIVQTGTHFFALHPQRSTWYELTGTRGACTVRDQIFIEVDRQRKIYIPNIFSPNNDGANDFFYVQTGEGVIEIEQLQIFQRFGDMVFSRSNIQPNNPAEGWDGTFKGKPLNPAVFVYRAVIRFKDGQSELFTGDVTLVR